MLLGGKAVYLVFEEGQEADLVYPVLKLLPAADAARVVPVEPTHYPDPVFNGHVPASISFYDIITQPRRRKKSPRNPPVSGGLVGVVRLELTASSSQSWRATSCATPR